ncbi:hypothetical protein J0H58_14715 [bacterium]|nr:hypothetical protein [bacterium]
MVRIHEPGSEYVLNFCTKHLGRSGDPPPPDDENATATFRGQIAEAWRFPIIGLVREKDVGPKADDLNLVTFVYKSRSGDQSPVSVLGTFASLCEPLPLKPVLFEGEDTGYRSVSVTVPKGELHTYKFLVQGNYYPDPINPQRVRFGNGRVWSRFFTDEYLQPLILELWELRLLYRLVEQILPFRTAEAENFLQRHYFSLDKGQKVTQMAKAFRLDDSVGEVNAIDKLLAREEAHRLVDYRVCLKQIDRALRALNPYTDPYLIPAEQYIELYNSMAASRPGDGSVPGWDYAAYDNPAFFIYLLRRHAVSTAFSHPKYAGNVGAAGWAYLSERYADKAGATLFDWEPALEKPLGTSEYYR